jgi:hypothetical protein
LRGLTVGVFGILCVGSGGGGDLYRGLGLGLLLGLLVVFGEDLALPILEAILFSLSSFGRGGTGGTPFCPATTTRDFRLEDFEASRKTEFGDGCPEEFVPEAEDPKPESRSESRLDVGDGEGVLDDVCVCGRSDGSRVVATGAISFFSNVDADKVGRGSSSLTIIV